MAWTWTGYVDRGVKAAIQTPSIFAFGSVLLAFAAGFHLMSLKHSGTPTVDYSIVALLLIGAILWGFFMTRAVHRLRK